MCKFIHFIRFETLWAAYYNCTSDTKDPKEKAAYSKSSSC